MVLKYAFYSEFVKKFIYYLLVPGAEMSNFLTSLVWSLTEFEYVVLLEANDLMYLKRGYKLDAQ